MNSLIAYIVATLALIALGFGLGTNWASHRSAAALSASRQDTRTCMASAHDKQSALDILAKQSADRLQQLQTMRAAAQLALDQRDAAQHQLQVRTQARVRAITQVTHASSDCHALAVMPVCPAVAGRLWGQVAGHDTTASYQRTR